VADAMVQTAVPDVGDTIELGHLYAAHSHRILGLLVRLGVAPRDAEDALHDTFVVAWRRLGTLRDPAAIVAWLNGIAIRIAAASRRRAWMRRFVGLDAADEPTESTTPASVMETRRARQVVDAALDGINDRKRTVFILFELQGMTGQEIAQAVGCPLKTVWTRLFHARREFLARVEAIEGVQARRAESR
jgi:RNA polymerase sigma-70 factor, ECF subfamily